VPRNKEALCLPSGENCTGMHRARIMARRRDVNDTELADFTGAVAFPRKVLTADLNRHCGASLRN